MTHQGTNKNTTKTYESAEKAHFSKFIKIAKWDKLDRCTEVFLELDKDGEWTPKDNTFIRFAYYLHQTKVSPSTFKNCMAMCWNQLNEYLVAKNARRVQEGFILNIYGVRECQTRILETHRTKDMLEMNDIQGQFESGISKTDMMQMASTLWRLDLPCAKRTFVPLTQLNCLMELTGTHQTQDRHDDLQREVFAQCFTRFREDIGPNGRHIHCTVSKGGKTNKNGNRVYTAMLPHRNPLLCGVAARGCLYLHRFLVEGEDVPHWKTLDSMYKKRTLRSEHHDSVAMSADTMSACFKTLYSSSDVHCAKVLHMGRRQGQQDLADAGVPMETIKRWCKYIYDEQSLSYILDIQPAPLLQRGGYNHQRPLQAHAAHLSVDVSHLVGELLPSLVQYEHEVAHALAMCQTFQAAEEERLFVARGDFQCGT